MSNVESVQSVVSRDGTQIAYEQSGAGPALILIGGAFGERTTAAGLAALLAPRFTVFAYDRRGRGGSGDTPTYAVEREVEDLEALIDRAGGAAFVYGHSSGAALAIEASAEGLPIGRLVLYEPPYIVEAFWEVALQMPPAAIADARKAPFWPHLESLAHTLPYDQAIVAPHQAGRPLPAEWARKITLPTLVLDGGDSPTYMRNAVAAVAELLPNAERRTIPGQGHGAPPDVMAPIVTEFLER